MLSCQAGWQDPCDRSPIETAAREATEETDQTVEWKNLLIETLYTRYECEDPSLSTEIRLNRNGKLHYSFRLLVNSHAMSPSEIQIYAALTPKKIGSVGIAPTKSNFGQERTERLYWENYNNLPPKNHKIPGKIEIRFDREDIEFDCLSGQWYWKSSFRKIDTATKQLNSM